MPSNSDTRCFFTTSTLISPSLFKMNVKSSPSVRPRVFRISIGITTYPRLDNLLIAFTTTFCWWSANPIAPINPSPFYFFASKHTYFFVFLIIYFILTSLFGQIIIKFLITSQISYFNLSSENRMNEEIIS